MVRRSKRLAKKYGNNNNNNGSNNNNNNGSNNNNNNGSNNKKKRKRPRLTTSNVGTLTVINNKSNNKNPVIKVDEDIDWSQNKWINAVLTKNYLMDDGFLDLLEYQSTAVTKVKPDYQNRYIKTIGSVNKNPTSFTNSLLSQGTKFEIKVTKMLIDKVGEEHFINIGGDVNPRSKLKYVQTFEAMQKGIPIIIHGIVRNYEHQVFGIPDLLVRSDWLAKIVGTNDTGAKPLTQQEIVKVAPKIISFNKSKRLKRSNTKSKAKSIPAKSVKYHYVVVDIKFRTLSLTSDGKHLRNDGKLKAYKGQLYVYNLGLGEMQGYEPPHAFILGSKWKYVSGKQTYSGNNCFDCLGKIDYICRDKSLAVKTLASFSWIREVREKGSTWDLSLSPLPRKELYPNMCNNYDFPYHGLKKKFAQDIDEITLVWKCGAKQRSHAHSKGVYSWSDPKCTPEALGINTAYTGNIVKRILGANRSETDQIIYPQWIKNNWSNWQQEKNLELFVDFEMTCSVLGSLDTLPKFTKEAIIFLIGVGHIDHDTNEWTFKYFVTQSLDVAQEKVICKEFIAYVNHLATEYEVEAEDIPMYHWSHAEPVTWNTALSRHQIYGQGTFEWVDLLKVFQKEPIGVKGCLKYGLKGIAKAFHQHGLIESIWDGGSSCADGADAAVGAERVNKECQTLGTSFPDNPLTQEIIRYNEIDCKVLQEILYYLRQNHIKGKAKGREDIAMTDMVHDPYSVSDDANDNIDKGKEEELFSWEEEELNDNMSISDEDEDYTYYDPNHSYEYIFGDLSDISGEEDSSYE